ncbi:ufm1-specific protease 2-like isoform X2 [Watersipora subatra]
MYNRFTKELTSSEFTETNSNSYSDHVFLRLTTPVNIHYKFSIKKAELDANCSQAVEDLLASYHSDKAYYELCGADILISNNRVIGADEEMSVEKVFKTIEKRNSENDFSGRRKKSLDEVKVIYAKALTKLTVDKSDNSVLYSPIIHYKRAEALMVSVSIPIEAVIVVPKSQAIRSLFDLFFRSIRRQLHAVRALLSSYTGTEIPLLRMIYFWVHGMHFPLSMVLPASSQDNQLVDWRQDLHEKLMLLLDRPYFRLSNAYSFPQETTPSHKLINPHLSLSQSKLSQAPTGTVHTVYGKYTYHHYMQDKFDDDKWGCAYRSLQTLISWFNLQGYSNISIPTHREIQQTLVNIGDKEPSFVGSKQWIGSTEVGFVLDKLLNVTCKIMFVSSGAEMANKGRELVQHFQTQGTPIMIGGGVLAHTILGVYYNDQTGEIKFLILDPHYTGADDLKTVLDKGWCGWKGEDFWEKTAYYNMCMPQRPIEY